MTPRDDINKALEYHSNWNRLLETALFSENGNCAVDLGSQQTSCNFDRWLSSQRFNSFEDSNHYLKLLELHEAYHRALETIIGLYEKNSPEQARQYFEGDFKEKSLQLTAEMLRWISRLDQEELQRHETL